MIENEYYSITWHIENEVIHVIQLKDWTLEVAGWMVRDASTLMDSTQKDKVPIIVDGSRVPPHLYNVIEANKMFRANKSDKWGFTIIVGEKNFTQFVAQTMLQLAKIELRFTRNIDEALNILYRIYPNLPHES